MSQLERFCEDLGNPYLAHEHAHRYWWATQFVEGKTVVDIACGSGYGSRILAGKARRVIGIDLSAEAVESAKIHYALPNITYQVGDCTTFTVDEPVDVIVTFETFEHVSEDAQRSFIKQIKGALKPNGRLILSTPNRSEYSDKTGFSNEFHVHELTVEELEAMLRNSFKSVMMFGQRFLPVSWIAPLADSLQAPTGQVSCAGLDHTTGVTKLAVQPTFSPVYSVVVCTDEVLSDSPQPSSVLFDTSAVLCVANAAELRQHPDSMTRVFSSLPERLRQLEVQFSRELGVSYDMRNRLLALTEDLALCKIELSRQIERINVQQNLGSRTERIEEELSRQIERISRAIALLEGESGDSLRKQSELLSSIRSTYNAHATTLNSIMQRLERLEAKKGNQIAPTETAAEETTHLRNEFNELRVGYSALQREYFELKEKVQSFATPESRGSGAHATTKNGLA